MTKLYLSSDIDARKYTIAIRGSNGQILGTGVVITDDGLILTCYHVIGDIRTKTLSKTADIYFPETNTNQIAEVLEEYSDSSLDIAFIKIRKLSEPTFFAKLSESVYAGHRFRSFGFRKPKVFQGLYAAGEIRGRVNFVAKDDNTPRTLIQLSSNDIEQGMSGAPIVDAETNLVIGIISDHWITQSNVDISLSLAIPISEVVRSYPFIKERNPSLRSSESKADSVPVKDNQAFNVSDQLITSGPSTHVTTDQWTLDDALGYDVYAHAIARFLTHNLTEPPLCISIQAPWGSGKTSLMRMVQKEMDADAFKISSSYKEKTSNEEKHSLKLITTILRKFGIIGKQTHNIDNIPKPTIVENSQDETEAKVEDLQRNIEDPDHIKEIDNLVSSRDKVKPRMTVWFNAWKYESTEQVWAGIVDAIVQQVAERLTRKQRELFFFQLHLRRLDTDKIRRRIYDLVLTQWWQNIRPWIWRCLLAIVTFSIMSLSQYREIGLGGIAASSVIGGLQTVRQHYKAEDEVKNKPAKVVLGEYVDIPDYRANLGFIHHVEKDLQRVFKVIHPRYHPLVIFIDDLDRCSPGKVASVMEAINLFLAGEFPNCLFILGMDPDIVAAALEKAHSDVISKMPNYSKRTPIGWRFMDKFVQLPFIIPSPARTSIENYVETLLSKESKKNKPMNGVVDSVKPNTIQPTNENVFEDEQIRGETFEKLDADIDKFSDKDPNIRQLIVRAAENFPSDNPRELKRFLNVFRLQYFLWSARKSKNMSVPTLEHLTDWIVLSLKWPEFVRWAQWSSVWMRYEKTTGNMFTNGKIRSDLKRNIAMFEGIGEKCTNNYENWQTEMNAIPELDSNTNYWIMDDGFRNFFIRQGSSTNIRFSSSIGNGLY